MNQGLLERFDVEFNKPERLGFLNNLSNANIVKLGDIINDQSYGILPPSNVYDEKNNNIIYLRATELKPDLNIDFNSCLKVPEKYYSNNRAILKKNDVLIAVKGATIASNKCIGFINNEIGKAILNGSIFRFQVKENINSKYIAYILDSDIGRKQMKLGLVANNAVDYLNKETIENFKIPLPPLEIQNQIVEKMDFALSEKKRKELEAKNLFESIDDLVLNELGIEYKEVEEKKVFAVLLNEVLKELRFDPLNFQKKDKHIEKTKYKIGKLSEFANINKGKSISSDTIVSGNIPVVAGGQTSPYNHNIANYNGNIITISASGAYSGYVWYHNYPIFASDCIVIFSKDENILKTEFLAHFLKVRQNYIYSLQQGAGQPHVYSRDIEELEIPLPPLEIQEKIANEVKNRIEKAKNLEKEVKEEYENAKREVEGMILI